MKNYILYHGQCYDGFGAAFAAWLKLGSEVAEYIPVLYGKPPPAMEAASDVYIVDFSYPAATLVELMKQHRRIVVLDHHATAEKDLSVAAFCKALNVTEDSSPLDELDGWTYIMAYGSKLAIRFDMKKSGAVLAWEHFHKPTGVPLFFEYLQDRDLWTFEKLQSREVSMALRSYPMDFKTWERLLTTDPTCAILRMEGIACRRLTEQQVEIMAKNHRLAVFNLNDKPLIVFDAILAAAGGNTMGCHVAPVANATVFFSEVGEKLLEMYPEAKFAAYYLDRSDGKRQWGLRSRPDFDCSVIAKAFGGGGHKQAAGFVQDL